MRNVKQSGIVPVAKRLTPEEITALENAGVCILVMMCNGHFSAAVGPTRFDSRTAVGCDDPIAFTLRSIVAQLRRSTDALEKLVRQC